MAVPKPSSARESMKSKLLNNPLNPKYSTPKVLIKTVLVMKLNR
jgi:hypothetical protein